MTVALVANIARPISSAISTAFSADSYGLLSSYGLLGASASPDAVIEALFANSEVGAWYDPYDLTTMFQDIAGTTPVTADGQPVRKILDKSGNGNHATAPSDAARPLYKTDGTYHWLQFDGVDDSLSTAEIDFTATDKMSVFSGVRKTSDVAVANIVELSTNCVAAPGTFMVQAPGNAGAARYLSYLHGASASTFYEPATFAAPIKNTVVTMFDLSASTMATAVRPYINGTLTQSFPAGSDSGGGGNFINNQLYIGNRSLNTWLLNGNIYSFIIRGALSTTQEITDTETWVNSKTGAY